MTTVLEALEEVFVKCRRKRVSRELFQRHHGVIQHGPFQGPTRDGEALSDNDRALVTSEGRRAIGEWLVVTP